MSTLKFIIFQEGIAITQTIPEQIAMHSAAYVGLKIRGLSDVVVDYVVFGLTVLS
ncbi:MAG: hypothetical protein ABDH19_01455 [Thermodesulfovibrio sp.]